MKSKQQQNKRAGLYYRLSKDDERAGESLSIENQKRMLEKYAVEQGFEIVDEYIDDGWSGTNFNRPEVKRLLEDAKIGRINVIIVKDLSRFGRNYIEVGQYTDCIFPMYNIRFIALGDNVDSANTENAGMDMMPIMNVFNEWHAANTSKKIRAVIESNAKAGKYRSNAAPYGYVKGNDEKKLPVRDEPAASNVLRMFQMRASGISPNKIADTFNDEGIKPPADYKEEKFGIPNTRKSHHLWSCSTVKQIITNPTYLGHLVQMRITTLSYKNKKSVKRDPEDMVWVYNTHEAIVNQELWDKCREMEASVSQGKKNRTGVVQPLSGLAYCADCGAKMHSGWNNTRHSRSGSRIYVRNYYNCGSFNKFRGRSCFSHYIKMETLEQIVLEDIRSKMQLVKTDEEKARTEFLKRCEQISSSESIRDRKRNNQIVRRMSELEKLISSVYEDKVSGKISEDICVNLLNKYYVTDDKGKFVRYKTYEELYGGISINEQTARKHINIFKKNKLVKVVNKRIVMLLSSNSFYTVYEDIPMLVLNKKLTACEALVYFYLVKLNSENKKPSVMQLAEYMNADKSNISKTVDKLCEADIVRRYTFPNGAGIKYALTV